jgi:hypothetical protein
MVMTDDEFGFFMAAGSYPNGPVLALLPSHLFLFAFAFLFELKKLLLVIFSEAHVSE